MLRQILETRRELKEKRRKLLNKKLRIIYISDLLDWLRQEGHNELHTRLGRTDNNMTV
jgi:hypothetical protein